MQENRSAPGTVIDTTPLSEKLAHIASQPAQLLAPGWGDPEVLATARGDEHLWARYCR